MKTRTTINYFLIVIFLFLSQFTFAQTFVNQDATGLNDGSSWVDAYTDLSAALEFTSSGEIWVAQGTYLPITMQNGSVSFIISNGVSLYGGFDGTESSVTQRDYENNPTILSGDINGDDIDDDFETNRSDNALHVVYVDSLIISPVTIDGFNIVSGHTDDDPDLPEINWRGGGLFSYSTIDIKNCNFYQNFGRSGGGLYLTSNTGGGSNSSFENCKFNNNRATAQSAGLFLNTVSIISIDACDFSFNQTTRGAFYPLFCDDVLVTNSTFTQNQTIDVVGFGGAIFAWNNTELVFSSCSFTENTAGNGGVIYIDGRDTDMNTSGAEFNNCEFNNNRALDFGGGAIYSWMSTHDINNSSFDGNLSNNGSHIFNGGDDKVINYSSTEFKGGNGTFGGAMTCYGTNALYFIEGCSFTDNQATTSGGALIAGFGAAVDIDNCQFTENIASFGGGISVQNDGTGLIIENCLFQSNEASGNGGGLRMNNSGVLFLKECHFLENDADIGGGIHIAETIDSTGSLSLNIENCRFTENTAGTQGAGINLFNVNGTMTNLVCANNFNVDGVAGGGMSINVGDNANKTLDIINGTIVNNFAAIGGGIACFTDSTDSKLTLNLQNTILFNIGSKDYEIEDGTPQVNSLGGNLSGDLTTIDIFTDVSDQNNMSDMFFELGQTEYYLTSQSPAVNAGISTGAPTTDIDGNPRIDEVDAGAFEFQGMINTNNPSFSKNELLEIFPNPASNNLNLSFESDWKGDFIISIFSIDGKEITNWSKTKNDSSFNEVLDISDLNSNVYKVVIDNGHDVITRKFIKVE